MADKLAELLEIERIPTVVDIGANPLDGGDPPYKPLLDKYLCNVIGFEAQESILMALQKRNRPHETYLPHVVGDGEPATLYVCKAGGMSSILKPSIERLASFNDLTDLGEVLEEVPVQTVRLDDIAEIEHLDYLKIDIQGGEREVFSGGAAKLAGCVVIQTEVAFAQTYENQPTIGSIDIQLRMLGFVPHTLADLRMWPISPAVMGGNRRQACRQIVEADLVYVRDFTRAGTMTAEQWKMLALIAHHCYQSYDLALRAILMAHALGALPENAAARYCSLMEGA